MPKFIQRTVRISDDGLGFADHLIHQVQLALPLRGRSNLFLRDLRGRPGKAREVKRAVLLERRQSVGRHPATGFTSKLPSVLKLMRFNPRRRR